MSNKTKGTSALGSGLVWFGAAVSIAEIEAGLELAPAAAGGRSLPVVAGVLLGHLLGGALLFLAALLGARRQCGAMDCAKIPFGRLGGGFFALLNIAQLVGWTAVMVAQGAAAAEPLLLGNLAFGWICIAIGALVAAWIFVGLRGVGRINTIAMALLFVLTALLTLVLLRGGGPKAGGAVEPMEGSVFWFAFELSAAMPLSWLPLAADYTKDARRPVAASATAATAYSVVSCWMYGVGLAAATLSEEQTIAEAMRAAGFGAAGLLVIVFSTVTTTFLDAYSAGESAKSLCARIPAKGFAVAVCAAGTLLAVRGVMDRYMDFLYLIASVFAPMAAVMLADAFFPRRHLAASSSPAWNFTAWALGFAAYHLALGPASLFALLLPRVFVWTCPIGATLPALVVATVTALLGGWKR